MGKNSTSSTQTTNMALPANQQANVDVLMQGALDWFNQGGRSFYPGDLVADFDPMQKAGQNMLINFAQGVGGDLTGSSIAANKLMMDPKWLDPSQNPYFTSVANDITNRTTQSFLENVLPQIGGGAIAAGQFGGSPQGVGEALASERLNQSLLEAQNQLALGQQGLGMQAFQNAIARAPGLMQLGMVPGQIVSGVGDVRQTQAQNEIKADAAKHEFEQNEPMAMLEFLKNITGRYGDYGGTQTTKATQETKGSPLNQVLGTAMALTSLWNPMTSMFQGLSPTNTIGNGFWNQAMMQGIPSPYSGGNYMPQAWQNMFPQVTG